MPGIHVNGVEAMYARVAQFKKANIERLMKRRQEVIAYLLEQLMDNIPVWSGRTIRSIRIGPTEDYAELEPEPTRSDSAQFGKTNAMAMGDEPMRAFSEAMARAQVGNAYSASPKVYLTIHSSAWDLVEKALAPDSDPHKPRNKAVVSEIAIAATKAKFGNVL